MAEGDMSALYLLRINGAAGLDGWIGPPEFPGGGAIGDRVFRAV